MFESLELVQRKNADSRRTAELGIQFAIVVHLELKVDTKTASPVLNLDEKFAKRG